LDFNPTPSAEAYVGLSGGERRLNPHAPEPRPGICSVCIHPDRPRIELARVSGVSLRVVADKYGVSKDSVSRHFRTHVSKDRKTELMAGPAAVENLANAASDESRSLLDYLSIARSVLFSQFLTAAEHGDRNGVAFLAGKLLDALREYGKLTGELRVLSGITVNNNTVNMFATPEFGRLQDGLLRIARAHPEARVEIVKLLRGLEAGPAVPEPTGDHPLLIEAEVEHA
jgi:hypothetical protein